jgi:hypothetical protein
LDGGLGTDTTGKSMETPNPVIVVWGDAHASHSEAEIDKIDHYDQEFGALITYSVGFLVKEDNLGVTLAYDLYSPKHEEYSKIMGGSTFIPRGMVYEIRTLVNKGGPLDSMGPYPGT